MLMFQHFVYCYCHDRPGIYSFLIVLKEADKVGWEKDVENNRAIQTNKDREIIVYSAPAKLQPRQKCRPALCKTPQQTISQLDADMHSKQWKGRKERKRRQRLKERQWRGREPVDSV